MSRKYMEQTDKRPYRPVSWCWDCLPCMRCSSRDYSSSRTGRYQWGGSLKHRYIYINFFSKISRQVVWDPMSSFKSTFKYIIFQIYMFEKKISIFRKQKLKSSKTYSTFPVLLYKSKLLVFLATHKNICICSTVIQ